MCLRVPNTLLRNVKLCIPSPAITGTATQEGVTLYTQWPGKQVPGYLSWWRPGHGRDLLCPCWRPFQHRRPFCVQFPVGGLVRRWDWAFPSLSRKKKPTNSARTYWAWPTRWSWSCRGPCPRCEHVESHSLARLLEMILKWRVTTRHIIWLQVINPGFPIFLDLGCLLTILPGLKHLKISLGWNPKVTTWMSFIIYLLGVHKGDFLLWIPTFLLCSCCSFYLQCLPPLLCHSNLSSPCNLKNCDVCSWGPQETEGFSISSINSNTLMSLLHIGCP